MGCVHSKRKRRGATNDEGDDSSSDERKFITSGIAYRDRNIKRTSDGMSYKLTFADRWCRLCSWYSRRSENTYEARSKLDVPVYPQLQLLQGNAKQLKINTDRLPCPKILCVVPKHDSVWYAVYGAIDALGYSKEITGKVDKAFNLFQKTHHHIVIIDMRFVNFPGLELCKSIRTLKRSRHSVLLALVKNTFDEPSDIDLSELIKIGFNRVVLETANHSYWMQELLQVEKGELALHWILLQNEAMFYAMERCRDLVIITTKTHSVQYANKPFCNEVGYQINEILTRPLETFYVTTYFEQVIRYLDRGFNWRGKISWRNKEGYPKLLECNAEPFRPYGTASTHFVYVQRNADEDAEEGGSISRKGSYDARSINSDGTLDARRESLSKLHNLPLEGPITKVISLICKAQENSVDPVVHILDRVIDILQTTELYASHVKTESMKYQDPVTSELIGALVTSGPSVSSGRRSSRDPGIPFRKSSNAQDMSPVASTSANFGVTIAEVNVDASPPPKIVHLNYDDDDDDDDDDDESLPDGSVVVVYDTIEMIDDETPSTSKMPDDHNEIKEDVIKGDIDKDVPDGDGDSDNDNNNDITTIKEEEIRLKSDLQKSTIDSSFVISKRETPERDSSAKDFRRKSYPPVRLLADSSCSSSSGIGSSNRPFGSKIGKPGKAVKIKTITAGTAAADADAITITADAITTGGAPATYRKVKKIPMSTTKNLNKAAAYTKKIIEKLEDGNQLYYEYRHLFSEEVISFLNESKTWNFDIFEVEKLTPRRTLAIVGMHILLDFNVPATLNCSEKCLFNWLCLMESNYRYTNTYHNSTHAADVLQATSVFLRKDRLLDMLDELDQACCLIAAIAHDVDHPGKSSAFLCNAGDNLAILYNDISVLESHHASLTFQLTLEDSNVNIFAGLDAGTFRYVRQTVIDMILATEMTKHFEHLTKFVSVITKQVSEEERKFLLRHAGSYSIDNEPTGNGDKTDVTDEPTLVKRMLIKCADVCNPTRPLKVSIEWSRRIAEEYFLQTDEEKARQLPVVMPMFDREKCSLAKSQAGFIDFIVSDMFEAWHTFVDVSLLTDHMYFNYHYWNDLNDNGITSMAQIYSEENLKKLPTLDLSQIKTQRIKGRIMVKTTNKADATAAAAAVAAAEIIQPSRSAGISAITATEDDDTKGKKKKDQRRNSDGKKKYEKRKDSKTEQLVKHLLDFGKSADKDRQTFFGRRKSSSTAPVQEQQQQQQQQNSQESKGKTGKLLSRDRSSGSGNASNDEDVELPDRNVDKTTADKKESKGTGE